MRRPLIAIAGILAVIAPAIAQDIGPGAGRFQITPSEEGFTRLDTETGSIAHCGKRGGVWHCEPLDGADSGLQQKLDELAGAVARLGEDVDALTVRVETLAGRLDALVANRPGQSVGPTPEEEAQRADEALNFAEKVMRRFFDMVREMKREDGNRI